MTYRVPYSVKKAVSTMNGQRHPKIGRRPRLTSSINTGIPDWPFGLVAGPVYTVPVLAAVLTSKLSKPWQVLCGYAYPFAKQFNAHQPPPLWAPQAVTVAGIGIQQGQFAIVPATDNFGQFLDDSEF
jgi:hypothetical protein